MVGIVQGRALFILIRSGPILSLYKISPETQALAQSILFIMAAMLWIKAGNTVMIIGIMRSGAATRVFRFHRGCRTYVADRCAAGAGRVFVWHLPVLLVYLLVMCDECTKFAISLWRTRSMRWIHVVG